MQRKFLAKKHVFAINRIMLNTVSQLLEDYAEESETDTLNLQICASDIERNMKALGVFNSTNDCQPLYNSLVNQNPAIQPYFNSTLRYIKDNDLIEQDQTVCI